MKKAKVKVRSVCPYGGGWRGEHSKGVIELEYLEKETRNPLFISVFSTENDGEQIAEICLSITEAQELCQKITKMIQK